MAGGLQGAEGSDFRVQVWHSPIHKSDGNLHHVARWATQVKYATSMETVVTYSVYAVARSRRPLLSVAKFRDGALRTRHCL